MGRSSDSCWRLFVLGLFIDCMSRYSSQMHGHMPLNMLHTQLCICTSSPDPLILSVFRYKMNSKVMMRMGNLYQPACLLFRIYLAVLPSSSCLGPKPHAVEGHTGRLLLGCDFLFWWKLNLGEKDFYLAAGSCFWGWRVAKPTSLESHPSRMDSLALWQLIVTS